MCDDLACVRGMWVACEHLVHTYKDFSKWLLVNLVVIGGTLQDVNVLDTNWQKVVS